MRRRAVHPVCHATVNMVFCVLPRTFFLMNISRLPFIMRFFPRLTPHYVYSVKLKQDFKWSIYYLCWKSISSSSNKLCSETKTERYLVNGITWKSMFWARGQEGRKAREIEGTTDSFPNKNQLSRARPLMKCIQCLRILQKYLKFMLRSLEKQGGV